MPGRSQQALGKGEQQLLMSLGHAIDAECFQSVFIGDVLIPQDDATYTLFGSSQYHRFDLLLCL